MFARDYEIDRTTQLMNQLWRGFDRAFQDLEPSFLPRSSELRDEGAEFVFSADVPGATLDDVKVTLAGDVLNVEVRRHGKPDPSWSVHRRERRVEHLARSWVLPVAVDAERTTARLVDGVLTVTVAKSPEEQPRSIAVKAS
jgi:HSP20 family protein